MGKSGQNALGIYIHIPFCIRKCNYCDFLSFPAGEMEQNRYTDCLVEEMHQTAFRLPELSQRHVDTVFLGGGTPGILSATNLERIMAAVYESFSPESHAEISMECNPAVADADKLLRCRKAGVNRFSLGVQSAVDAELVQLGRVHTFFDAVKSFEQAREAGFSNINIDLMSGIPKQSIQSYQKTLNAILAMKPEHISAYSLIIEEGTPFYSKYSESPPVDEETDREMYAMTKEMLESAGYGRYEISNYAREGYACKHNLKYWSNQDYLGFGLGASSKIGNVRYRNIHEPKSFLETIKAGKSTAQVEEILGPKEQMAEFFLLGLRKCQGVSLYEFENEFGCCAETVYGEVIQRFVSAGVLVLQSGQLRFTQHGFDVSNYVLCEFL